MAHMHFTVTDDIAKSLRMRAQVSNLSLSRYLAALVNRELGKEWPAGYFDEVIGGWQGKPLHREANNLNRNKSSR